MSRSPLRVAIVGAGLMGRWHADSAARAGGVVSAIVDADPTRARALAARHGAAVLDLDALLGPPRADVVHVCTPLNTHAAIAGAAIRAGLAVLVEKPLARDPAETDALLREAAARRVLVCPVHQFPFQTAVRRVRSDASRLGSLLHVDYVACSAGATGRAATEVSAIVADILPHPLSLLRRFMPGPLHELEWRVWRPAPGEFRASALSGDTTVGLLVSMAGRPTRNTLRLVGTAGTAHVDLFHGFATLEPGGVSRVRKIARPFAHAAATMVVAATNLGARAIRREPAYPGLRELVGEFYRAVREGGPPPIDADEVRDVARTRALLAGHPVA